jgi:hypothetical protein
MRGKKADGRPAFNGRRKVLKKRKEGYQGRLDVKEMGGDDY